MRLFLSAATCVCASLAIAGPAEARPVDFELAPELAPASAAAAGDPVTSRRIATARRFNLVGLRWRSRAEPRIDLRVRRPGRGWSRWEELAAHAEHNPDRGLGERRVGASDPLWVGRADAVQYRLSRRVRGLRLHFVDLGRRPAAGARAAQDTQPGVVSRAEWGAGACQPRSGPDYGSVNAVYVHHTVSLNDYAPEEGPSIVLAICRYHRNSNGWNDIGYNALVDKYGVLYEGRAGGLDAPVVGAHAEGYNSQAAGISSIADHTTLEPSAEAMNALAGFIRWKLGVHGQPLSGEVTITSAGGGSNRHPAGRRVTVPRVLGHRDTNSTACPGNLLHARLAELRLMVESGAGFAPVFSTRLSAILADTRVNSGDIVPLSGYLTGPDGGALGGEPLEIQANANGRWRTVAGAVTAADGSYAAELQPRLRQYVRVRYPGRPDLAGASSPRLLLRVRPQLVLNVPPRQVVVGSRVTIRGSVLPRKRSVQLVLQQLRAGRWRNVGSSTVRVRDGRFRASFVPGSVARYRFYVVARADVDTDRGATPFAMLRVARR